MPKSPPEGFPTVCPYLYYQDVAAAIDWLAKAFGFEKRMAMPGPGGTVMHAEMDIGEGVVMLGPANAQQGSQSPRARPARRSYPSRSRCSGATSSTRSATSKGTTGASRSTFATWRPRT